MQYGRFHSDGVMANLLTSDGDAAGMSSWHRCCCTTVDEWSEVVLNDLGQQELSRLGTMA